jgi:trehalose-6-phosphate synthase
VLWPLFHYRENFDYEDTWYDHYVTANQLFADAVSKVRACRLLWLGAVADASPHNP